MIANVEHHHEVLLAPVIAEGDGAPPVAERLNSGACEPTANGSRIMTSTRKRYKVSRLSDIIHDILGLKE
jgi:hypothetical protein